VSGRAVPGGGKRNSHLQLMLAAVLDQSDVGVARRRV